MQMPVSMSIFCFTLVKCAVHTENFCGIFFKKLNDYGNVEIFHGRILKYFFFTRKLFIPIDLYNFCWLAFEFYKLCKFLCALALKNWKKSLLLYLCECKFVASKTESNHMSELLSVGFCQKRQPSLLLLQNSRKKFESEFKCIKSIYPHLRFA